MTMWSAVQTRFRQAPRRWSASVAAALFLGYSLFLGWRVVSEFEQRHWDVPAHVYAAPLELHAGLPLSVSDLTEALANTGYAPVDDLRRPGEFLPGPRSVRLWTRPFQFWDGAEPSRQLQIELNSDRVVAISDETGRQLPIVRLEPMRLGSMFATHHEDRILVEPDAIPPLLIDALIAVEDRKFNRHHGIDVAAIVRAAWVNLQHGEVRQGASTLTQQLVKSYFLDGRKTFTRKYREAIMAIALELRYDKQELLHAYVNEIYLGQQGARAIHGFGLASEFYFAKRLDELSLHEIALLVAIVKGPSFYDPRRQPQRAAERRNWVLATLAERGVIAAAAAVAASEQDLGVATRAGIASRYQPSYLDLVRAQLAADYSADELATQGLRVFTSLEPNAQATAERELARGLERLSRDSDGTANALEGAVVITRPQTGEVVALVGGRNAGFDGFNRALDAKRPVGSLIKPLVYLAALETNDYTLASTITDAPIDVLLENGDTWSPENFTRESHGDVPLIRALADSYNQATVRLGLDVGVDKVARLFDRLGLDTAPPAYPSLLLGAVDLSAYDVAQLYNSLANGGDRIPLKAVRSVTDADGQPLNRYSLELTSAAGADAVQQLNHALVQVIERGTGSPARDTLAGNLRAAGKTGTSDDFKDSWFAGFTNEHLAVVWLGRDDNSPVGLTGSAGALTVWAPILADLKPASSFDPPSLPALADVWIDYDTGLMTREGCAGAVPLPYPLDAELPRRLDCGLSLGQLGRRMKGWFERIGNRQ